MSYCDYHEKQHGKGGCPSCNNDRKQEKRMEKKMVLLVKDGYEGRNDLVYEVGAEGFDRLAHDLVEGWGDYPDELPKIELAMWTSEQLNEAERIGEEMA